MLHEDNIKKADEQQRSEFEPDFDLQSTFNEHTHNGQDSKKIAFSNVTLVENAAISAPSGGSTIDSEARTAINAIITELENRGFIKEN